MRHKILMVLFPALLAPIAARAGDVRVHGLLDLVLS